MQDSLQAAGLDDGEFGAVTGSQIAPPLGAVLVTDLAAAQRRQLVSALRGQGFITGESIAMLATDFLQRADPNEFADRIRDADPALILIGFGGPQGAVATDLAAQVILHLHCRAALPSRPAVMLMGNQDAIAGARRELESEVEVLTLEPDAANPENLSDLHRQFASAYQSASRPATSRQLPPRLRERPLIPLTAALRRAAWRLSHLMGLRLAVAHVEPRGVTLALADRGSVRLAGFGQRSGANRGGHFALQLAPDEITDWLPVQSPAAELQAAILEGAGRPWGVPATPRARLIQEAAIVAGLSRARAQLRLSEFECDLVIASGSMLGGDSAPLAAATCLLNGLLPVRFCQLAQDQASALPMLGCLDLLGETVDPTDALAPLAISVAASGSARPNEAALHVVAEGADGARVEEVVPFGATTRVSGLAGQPVRIGVSPAGGLDVGGGPGRVAGLTPFVDAGGGGLLVDARGRPPFAGRAETQRSDLVLSWLQGWETYGGESAAVFGEPD